MMESPMRHAPFLTCAVFAVAFAFPSLAQDAERYQLERTEDGYIRLDTRTGAMATCAERSGQLVCRLAADERQAYEDRIDTLDDRLQALEERVAALEASPAPAAGLPDEEEFEQTLGYMERFFRRFMEIVTSLDREFGSGREPAPEPDRT